MNRLTKMSTILLASGMLLAGCGGSEGLEKKKEQKTLSYTTVKDIGDMNPHVYGGSMSAESMIYEPLVRNTKEGIKPLLAKKWDISNDGKTYTFHLREDVTFHDGTKFDAAAVKKNVDAVQQNRKLHSWLKISTLIDNVKVKDKYTVQLHLKEAYQPALAELAMPRPYVFVSPKDFKNGTTKDGVKSFDGTGPFKMGQHHKDESAEFNKNNQYWGEKAKLDKVEAKVKPAGETAFLSMKKGETNFAFTDDRGTDSLDKDSLNQLKDTGQYQIKRSQPMNTKMLVVNSGNKDSAVSDKTVRQALGYMVNRDKISQDILDGQEKPATQLFAKNVTDINFNMPTRQFDTKKAEALLDEAGWKLTKEKNVRQKNGKDLTLSMYYDKGSSNQKEQAEYLQAEFKKLGVKLNINGETSDKVAERRTSGDYDLMFNQTWGLLYDPQSTLAALKTKTGYESAMSGIKNKSKLYKDIDEAFKIQNSKDRSKAYQNILKQVDEEGIFIPISYGRMTVVAPKDLDKVSFTQSQYELPFNEMQYK
ncbi:staphylopine-dependent metal ABC transporter substrate-binding lipoprotein [Staphylococcus capitis]|uniref:staphylopine-dependent metal ABC transporter substrate-binding lipoprotein n=1 Tax=Staphylococcus capitis TaxID=29388 RepID=UPI0001EF4B38|nr:nickel ABC transporter substrate-binding protein [Staphylococcus capitis]EFS16580.1 nickel ABC transporter, periplasmic nickel-binding protein [Staphylococcus capitis C87]MDS3991045.1 nickel ABC transporter substrate-binding protein [Staphylococcus capitis]MDS4000303.1 nickel ABC transporter substrate-binding protein [Staphylococcus capitis]QKH89993.1 nickel ABC transporter, nickel/metallophore periplasmic binding protein [Staphylococcus capitis]